MTHAEFVAAYREGRLHAKVDRSAAARLVSGRLLLPFVLLPVLGAGVALALLGHLVAGVAVFVGGLALRFVVRASSQGFVINRSLQDERFYEDMREKGILTVEQR